MSTSPANRRLLAATVALSCLCIVAFVVAVWSFETNHQSACAARNSGLDVDVALLKKAQAQTDSDPAVSAAKKAASDLFVAQSLQIIDQHRC